MSQTELSTHQIRNLPQNVGFLNSSGRKFYGKNQEEPISDTVKMVEKKSDDTALVHVWSPKKYSVHILKLSPNQSSDTVQAPATFAERSKDTRGDTLGSAEGGMQESDLDYCTGEDRRDSVSSSRRRSSVDSDDYFTVLSTSASNMASCPYETKIRNGCTLHSDTEHKKKYYHYAIYRDGTPRKSSNGKLTCKYRSSGPKQCWELDNPEHTSSFHHNHH